MPDVRPPVSGTATPALGPADDAQLRQLVDTARDAFVSIDAEGRTTEWNRRAEELFGWTREEALGELLADLVVPAELREAHLLGVRRFVATGRGEAVFQRLQLPALHRSGRRLEVEFTIWPSRDEDGEWRFHAFLHDVAAEQRAERYLRLVQRVAVAANEAQTVEAGVRATLDAIREATSLPLGHAFLTDGRDTPLEATGWWSPRPREPLAEATVSTPFPVGVGLPGRVAASGHAAWVRDIAEEDNFPRRDAALAAGLRAAFAFPVASGSDVVAVLEFFAADASEPNPQLLDVMEAVGTQLGRAFERVRAMEELREAVEERKAIVSIVSHELRGPLAAAHSASSLLHDDLPEDHPSSELLGLLDRQLTRLRRLVDDLLTAQRLDAGATVAHVERVALAPLVRQVVADSETPDVEVRVDDDVVVTVDRDHLEQMVWNLLVNAATHGEPPIRVAATVGDGDVEVAVSDSGPGIPVELERRLFERFARGPKSGGSGLGLSIVHGLTAANRGSVAYRAEPLPTFVLRLPGA